MISYWKQVKDVYIDDGMTLISGWYDHKNSQNGGVKALGIHWGDYPQSRGVLSPCVVPEATRTAILTGLLCQAVMKKEPVNVQKLTEAIRFFEDATDK